MMYTIWQERLERAQRMEVVRMTASVGEVYTVEEVEYVNRVRERV
jgi:hypothetical protein